MATEVSNVGSSARDESWAGVRLLRWTASAWGAIATTALFIGLTIWWLAQDRSIPIFDAGLHLSLALAVHSELDAGHILHALTLSIPYPPLAYLVGDLGIAVGGLGVAPPIIAENLVFVPLLALGCYQVARLAFDSVAGLLAVIFALGSPLIIAQFHVFMIDAPETAMVAMSLWAIIATRGFSRVWISALAGLAVGLGMLIKEPFVFFVAGPVLVTAIRGGVQSWRGMLSFALVVLVVALPWYAQEYSHVQSLGSGAINAAGQGGYSGGIAPPRFSVDNFTWYFWSLLNFQLYLPLLVFSAIGWVWMLVGFLRRKLTSRLAPELAIGSLVAWLAITETFTHDPRYSMPLLPYLAVVGAGWITRLRRPAQVALATVLVVVAVINVAGTSFGVGKAVHVRLPGTNLAYRQEPGFVTIFAKDGFLTGKPSHDGDMLATLRDLKRNGVKNLFLNRATLFEPDFSAAGLAALAQIAGLEAIVWEGNPPQSDFTLHDAVFAHGKWALGAAPPCVRLSNGTGVWIRLGNPNAPGARDFCPSRTPKLYGP